MEQWLILTYGKIRKAKRYMKYIQTISFVKMNTEPQNLIPFCGSVLFYSDICACSCLMITFLRLSCLCVLLPNIIFSRGRI